MSEYPELRKTLVNTKYQDDYETYVEVFKYVINEKQFSTIEDADYQIKYEKNGQTRTCMFGRTNTHVVIKMCIDDFNPDQKLRAGSCRKASEIAGTWKQYSHRKIFGFFPLLSCRIRWLSRFFPAGSCGIQWP